MLFESSIVLYYLCFFVSVARLKLNSYFKIMLLDECTYKIIQMPN